MKTFFLLFSANEALGTEPDRRIAGLTSLERNRKCFRLFGIEEIFPGDMNFRQKAGGKLHLFVCDQDAVFDIHFFETLTNAVHASPDSSILFVDGENDDPVGLGYFSADDVGSLIILEEDRVFVDWKQAKEKGRAIPISSLAQYDKEMRKRVQPEAFHCRKDKKETMEAHLLDMSSKGTNEWVAKLLHPWPQNRITEFLWKFPWVSPNMVTAFNILLSVITLMLFLLGHFTLGALLACVVSMIDGVDGKLARTTLRFSKSGHFLDHVSDFILESLWYLAIGWSLSRQVSWSVDPFFAAVLLIIFYTLDRTATGTFAKHKNVQLHDYRRMDRIIRFWGARRSTNFMILLIGGIAGMFAQTFAFVVIFSALTALFKWVRHIYIRTQGIPAETKI